MINNIDVKNNTLYKIDDFYIGKLSFSCKPNDHTDLMAFFERIQFFDEAINYPTYPKNKNGKMYQEFYTLFLKQNETYLCLHDNNFYKETGNYYCSCLTSFKKYFPKIDFILPKQLTINDALNYFNSIIKNSNGIQLYNKNTLHSVNDYFIGSLNLLTKETNIDSEISIEKNFINYHLLRNNGWNGFYSCYNNERTEEMNYDFFLKCLFIKIADSYYNINDFNFYTNIESDNSFCHHLISYKDYIKNFNIAPKEYISIYQANKHNSNLEKNKTKIKKLN